MKYLLPALVAASLALGGCTVITVAGTAVGVAATAGSLAVDAAVGTAKIAGKAAGLAADVVLPSSGDK